MNLQGVGMGVQLACAIALATCTWGWSQDRGLISREDEDAKIERLVRERREQEENLTQEPTSLDGGASVNPRLLKAVRDNAFGIRYEERDVYFRTLELAMQTPLELQERFLDQFRKERRQVHFEVARQYLGQRLEDLPTSLERNRVRLARALQQQLEEFPTFQDIVLYPDANRGHLVSIHGVMRKLTKFDPGKNERGIREAYEAWIYTADSPAIPTVAVFINKPEHLEVGGDLAEEVQVTGYFLKMYVYKDQLEPTRAPLVLAEGLLWHPREQPYTPQSIPLEIYLLITLLAALGAYALWRTSRRDASARIHPRVEPDFSAFPPTEQPVVTEDSKVHIVEPNDS